MQTKWHKKRDMQVGDIVIIQDSKLSSGQWKLGCVTEVIPGRDYRVRRVTVKYRNENSKSFTFIQRPDKGWLLLCLLTTILIYNEVFVVQFEKEIK